MIVNINKAHPIFNSCEYLNDIIPFNLIEVIKQSPMLLASDEKSFIIGMVAPQMPTWVWTSDKIPSSCIDELCDYFYNKFKEDNHIHYVAKPAIAKKLSRRFVEEKNATVSIVNMGSYECTDLIPARNNTVLIERANKNDTKQIAECLSEFEFECFGKKEPLENFMQQAEQNIKNPLFFVIKDNGKIVSTAKSARETEAHITINGVYTKPEYRNQGYASAIVAYICKIIFSKGKNSILYTDLSNPSSNKAYKNIGFTECGKIDEIILKWKNK